MMIVTGANGRLGSQIVEQLLGRVPAETVGVSVRDPAQASALAARGVRVRAGDFTEPDGLEHAFEGADQVLVVSALIRGPGAAAANIAAIQAARAAGARHIIYTSHQASSADSLFAAQHTHAATEQHLTEQDVPFTSLRNGFYASTLEHYIGDALSTGQLIAPEDGPASWTAHADLAEAGALALTADAPAGITPPLTAGEALDFDAVAGILSELAGRPIERVTLSDEAWAEAAIAGGMPPMAAEFTLGLFRASRRGEFAVTDPALATVIGHPTTTLRSVLETLVP
jgi:NAD(P)H dehydrogenase (quinone)